MRVDKALSKNAVTNKAAIIRAINEAKEAKLREQDAYRVIIKAAIKTEETADEFFAKFGALGRMDGLNLLMADERMPPDSSDWETVGVAWEDTPSKKQLNQVDDPEIRSALFFYSQIAEHTERISAMAKYYGHFGATSFLGEMFFRIWHRQDLDRALGRTPTLADEILALAKVTAEKFSATDSAASAT